MTPRERMQAAMNFAPVDRVPVMCQFSIGHMLLQLGVSPADFWCDARTYVDGLFRLRDMYDFDGILVSLYGHDPAWRNTITSRKVTQQGEEITWNDGSRTFFPLDELPRHFPADAGEEHTTRERAGALSSGPLSYIPVSQGLRFGIDPLHPFDAIEEVVRRSNGLYSVHGEVTSPFDYVLDEGGHQAVLLALLDDPLAVKEALSSWTAKVAALAERMCATGIDAIKISSPYAGAGFISPACYREFVLPYEREIVHSIQSRGVKAYLHTCGTIRDRIELMLASGTAGIECLDPPPLGNIDLAEALRMINGRCFVKGNVDSVNLLLRGTPAEIRGDLRSRLEAGSRSGGYILSTACSIAPRVPREHVLLMREAVERRDTA